MENQCSCQCSSGPKLIFACSGASNLGYLADQAARQMTKEGAGKMYCLTGIGGRVNPIMVNTQAASKILAIDGCELDCTKNCLKQAGFENFEHLRLSDMGMKKGVTPVNDESIAQVVSQGKEKLGC